MSRALRTALGKLIDVPDGQLAGSQLTAAQKTALDEFIRQTGAVTYQQAGRGVSYRIKERVTVERHWREMVPSAGDALDEDLPSRAANIAQSRMSKSAAHGHDSYYLLLRTAGNANWYSDNGDKLDLQWVTDKQGAAALAIGGACDQSWHTTSELWLVENQALFDRLDWLPQCDGATIAYYSGHLQKRLIDWLSSRNRASRIWLFPDYDGVGLSNYLRIKQVLGSQVNFWIMPGWEKRLLRYGNNKLWLDTASAFNAAVPVLLPMIQDESELFSLIETMQRNGLALEQEVVWIDEF
ncbi:MAG: hypothetical protein R3271_01825 [Methylophaga sp.]|uniref:DUF7281 domain-containing protein n=1 Tax=Methylophaga sp. TaxID=2024840 RepID=UPI00299D836F|nr:hypothetical protein [Methylophaga sp.]MDX1749041.1 hypothetical protein [Methylophaga sp.]